jgi:mono/diheme cytochrome c family protein
MGWRKVLMIAVAVVVVEAVLIVGGFLVVMYSGIYNVAASNPDPAVMDWALGTISDRSVENHASGIPTSPTFESPDLAVGYDHYSEMCVFCHGAPGVDPSDAVKGMNPNPPDLMESVTDMTPSQVFWVVKNGIKMTGMPAFGPTHDDQTLWNIAAFVKGLPAMTPEQYAAMGKPAAADGQEKQPEPAK